MKKIIEHKLFYGLLAIVLFLCCDTPSNKEGEIRVLQDRLMQKTKKINELEQDVFPKGKLIHVVYFDLNEKLNSIERTAFISEVNTLKKINSVEKLVFGSYMETGDQRAMKDLEMVMHLTFKDVAALNSYETDPIHLAVKENVRKYLIGPPKTYDFIAE